MMPDIETKQAPWLIRLVQGAIIGISAILPGISGGALSVVFGIYQPMMALLAHPFRTFKTHMRLLLPVVIGGALGFFGLARVVEWMFRSNYNLAVWFFIGLIVGMLPSLFKEAGSRGRTGGSWAALLISAVVSFSILFIVQSRASINITPNTFWFFVCGLLWGLGMVVPGMSPSSILIFLGLYQPMAAGIAELSMKTILPLMAGVLLIVLAFARAINSLFEKNYGVAFHIILGFVIASTLAIIPLDFRSSSEAIGCALCFAAGFGISWLMDKTSQKKRVKQ
jgi:putative membrane protein